jgi:uncharacterized protein (TIGR02145 family)
MINNLKLGSTTGSVTLTNADTDLNTIASFTLPQLTTSGSTDYDNPIAFGPVPNDTGAGDTNYGYLYNWPAATAGESRTTMPGDGTNNNIAPNSICPANWKLPRGGDIGATTNDFDILNAKMAGYPDNQDSTYQSNYYSYYANWQNSGPFQGVFSGYWGGSFGGQGVSAYLWSSSADSGYSDSARYVFFDSSYVDPVNYFNRYFGFGVRCLLN